MPRSRSALTPTGSTSGAGRSNRSPCDGRSRTVPTVAASQGGEHERSERAAGRSTARVAGRRSAHRVPRAGKPAPQGFLDHLRQRAKGNATTATPVRALVDRRTRHAARQRAPRSRRRRTGRNKAGCPGPSPHAGRTDEGRRPAGRARRSSRRSGCQHPRRRRAANRGPTPAPAVRARESAGDRCFRARGRLASSVKSSEHRLSRPRRLGPLLANRTVFLDASSDICKQGSCQHAAAFGDDACERPCDQPSLDCREHRAAAHSSKIEV